MTIKYFHIWQSGVSLTLFAQTNDNRLGEANVVRLTVQYLIVWTI